MNIFITGASGYIGFNVAKAFRRMGHHVQGLVRKESSARLLEQEEIEPVLGEIDIPHFYLQAASTADVLVHCASESSAKRAEKDAHVIDIFIQLAQKSPTPKTFIYTSGIWVYGSHPHTVIDEDCPFNPIESVKWRPSHEEKVLQAASTTLHSVVIRPGMVYGKKGGLTEILFSGVDQGVIRIIGDGKNHWPMIHVDDLALAYVLAAEKKLHRTTLNISDGSTFTLRELAEAVAKAARLTQPVESIPHAAAVQEFGQHLIDGLIIDVRLTTTRMKELLHWTPYHTNFCQDAHLYLKAWQAAKRIST